MLMMTTDSIETTTVHGTCVELDGVAILLTGCSGSGKSDLALRLIDAGATLVSDDQVVLRQTPTGKLFASPPPELKGIIEVRGVGLRPVSHIENARLVAVIRLDDKKPIERLPELTGCTCEIMGSQVAAFSLSPFEASAPLKVKEIAKLVSETGF